MRRPRRNGPAARVLGGPVGRLRVGLVRVSGPSMVPTLRDGDLVVVVRGAPVRPGDVVVARYRSMPDRAVIKRAARPGDGGWWLESVNPFAGGDSAVHGVADPGGRAVLRWRWGRGGDRRRDAGWPLRRISSLPVDGSE